MSDSSGQIAALAQRVQWLEDEREILRAIERYGHSIDYGLEDEWVDCFTVDGIYDLRIRVMPPALGEAFPYAQVDEGGIRFQGREMLKAFISIHTRPPTAWHKHVVVDQVVSRDGDPDLARATNYFFRIDEIDGQRIIVAFGRYIDLLTRCPDSRWRFIERVVELESNAIAGPGDDRRMVEP